MFQLNNIISELIVKFKRDWNMSWTWKKWDWKIITQDLERTPNTIPPPASDLLKLIARKCKTKCRASCGCQKATIKCWFICSFLKCPSSWMEPNKSNQEAKHHIVPQHKRKLKRCSQEKKIKLINISMSIEVVTSYTFKRRYYLQSLPFSRGSSSRYVRR